MSFWPACVLPVRRDSNESKKHFGVFLSRKSAIWDVARGNLSTGHFQASVTKADGKDRSLVTLGSDSSVFFFFNSLTTRVTQSCWNQFWDVESILLFLKKISLNFLVKTSANFVQPSSSPPSFLWQWEQIWCQHSALAGVWWHMFLINVDYISSFKLATIALEAPLLLNINSPRKPDVQHMPQRSFFFLFFLLLGSLDSLSVWVQWDNEKSRVRILSLPYVGCIVPGKATPLLWASGAVVAKSANIAW